MKQDHDDYNSKKRVLISNHFEMQTGSLTVNKTKNNLPVPSYIQVGNIDAEFLFYMDSRLKLSSY